MASSACSSPAGVEAEPENCELYDRAHDVVFDDVATAPFDIRWSLDGILLATHARRALVFCKQGSTKYCVLQRCGDGWAYRGQLPRRVTESVLLQQHPVISDDEILLLSEDADGFLGAIFVFVEGETGWELAQQLSGGTEQEPVWLWGELWVSGDTMVAFGSPLNDQDKNLYVFSKADGTWVPSGTIVLGQEFAPHAMSVTLQPDRIVLGLSDIESVWTYERVGSDWQRIDELKPPVDRGPLSSFGQIVVQDGERLAVFGGSRDDGWALNVYRRENEGWTFDDLDLHASGDSTSVGIALHGTSLVFSGVFGNGPMYPRVFERQADGWNEQPPIMADPLLGARVQMSSDVIYFLTDSFYTGDDSTTYVADVPDPG